MYRPIHEDFVKAWRIEPTWESIRTGYVAPHKDFLRLFYRNFVSGDGDDARREDGAQDRGDDVRMETEFRTYWAERPTETDGLLQRLAGVDFGGVVHRTVERVRSGLRADCEVDVVSVIGLGTTNACQLIHNGVPTVVLAFDVWGTTFMNEPLPWSDIPLWLSHEYAHVVRYAEGESGFHRHIIGGSLDYGAAIEGEPFIEFLVDEGLATAAAQQFGGATNAAHALGFNEAQLAWCRANEHGLWREIGPRLNAPLTMDGYARYFSYGATDIVPRSAYFLGFTLVERFLNMTGMDLASGLRLPAVEFAMAVPRHMV